MIRKNADYYTLDRPVAVPVVDVTSCDTAHTSSPVHCDRYRGIHAFCSAHWTPETRWQGI